MNLILILNKQNMYTISQDTTTGDFYFITHLLDGRVIKTLIDLEKHNEELTPRTIIGREDHEDFLFDLYWNYNWTNKYLIKEDLKKILKIDDEYIFLPTDTNEFISPDDEETFNNICKDFIYYYWKNDNN